MKAWICLGSNLSNPKAQLKKALEYLQEKCYLTILQHSNVIVTKPYGFLDQPDFSNQLIEIETPLSAKELLVFLKNAEEHLGRKPTFKWGPRTIDMDIIFYGNEIIRDENLTVPHSGIPEREYLLKLLLEMIPEFEHPETRQPIKTLYYNFLHKGDKQ